MEGPRAGASHLRDVRLQDLVPLSVDGARSQKQRVSSFLSIFSKSYMSLSSLNLAPLPRHEPRRFQALSLRRVLWGQVLLSTPHQHLPEGAHKRWVWLRALSGGGGASLWGYTRAWGPSSPLPHQSPMGHGSVSNGVPGAVLHGLQWAAAAGPRVLA